MSTFNKIKNTALLCAVLIVLPACSLFSKKVVVEPVERVELNLQVPAPIKLKDVDWEVTKVDNEPRFSLDEENFQDLMINIERVQNRLSLLLSMIEKQKEFYESEDEK